MKKKRHIDTPIPATITLPKGFIMKIEGKRFQVIKDTSVEVFELVGMSKNG